MYPATTTILILFLDIQGGEKKALTDTLYPLQLVSSVWLVGRHICSGWRCATQSIHVVSSIRIPFDTEHVDLSHIGVISLHMFINNTYDALTTLRLFCVLSVSLFFLLFSCLFFYFCKSVKSFIFGNYSWNISLIRSFEKKTIFPSVPLIKDCCDLSFFFVNENRFQ